MTSIVPWHTLSMLLAIDELVLERKDGVHLLGPLGMRLESGERVGLVGESGSGKSLLIKTIFGVLPEDVRRSSGRISAFGVSMDVPGPGRDSVRGSRLAWMPQNPLQVMNPFMNVRDQVTLLPCALLRQSQRFALSRILPLMERLRLPTDRAFLRRFPQELSGGQRQRVLLAQALSCEPQALILDEPTTALDPTVQADFLDLMVALHQERGLAYLWVSHDLPLVSAVAQRMLVLYGGHLLEAGPTRQVLERPRHPYTARLLCAARGESSQETGFLPAPGQRPSGCPYRTRCSRAQSSCATWKPWQGTLEAGVRCEAPLAY